jgi:uncharacterized membrane protein YagU involved in acid resistance
MLTFGSKERTIMNLFEVLSFSAVVAVCFLVVLPVAKWLSAPGWLAVLSGILISAIVLLILGKLTSGKKKADKGKSDAL